MTEIPRMGAHEIRERFLKFFEERGHSRVASSSLIPQNDPTLLFVNAGMVQFKDVFLGRDPRDYTRATSSQVCLRAGGKHNDLDNVGFTPRHQTLFEMLGNFSFGDYFKEEAIDFAWTFLTEVLQIPSDRLVVSVFSGEGEDAPWDEEAYELWKQRVPEGRIYKCQAKENFWQMGDTGPCGPCTEIHIYKGGQEAPPTAGQPGKGPEHEEDLYTEIWNLVFMQYDKQSDGTLQPLPKPCVDTGAGLERLSCVMAGVESNYGTELLKPLVDKAKALAGVSGPQASEAPYQVIADHARAAAFLIADNVFPDRGGRNYVLRRIMRRAIRFGAQVGINELFLHEVCLEFVERFKGPYPQLEAARAVIEEVVKAEESSFRRTLSNGLKHFADAKSELPEGATEFPAAAAGKLYDTYGFPVDLTGVMARENGLTLDEDAVADWIAETQGKGSKGAVGGAGEGVADAYFHVSNALPDAGTFLGYEATEATGCELRAILKDGQQVQTASVGDEVELVFDQTPFYAESGGQIFDTGTVDGPATVEISDCQKPTGGAHFHTGKVTQGELKTGERYTLRVDSERRDAIRRNHSATHLLHHVLREVLGDHVIQKGSLVAPERLRFDFSHGKPLTPEQRQEIERKVADHVLDNRDTSTREMSLDDAKQAGAIGLFGEKYGDEVRVVGVGPESVELCGGTHVRRAGDIGLFAITSEVGIAQGVRRIEAVTGTSALAHFQTLAETVGRASESLKASDPQCLLDRIERLQDQLKRQSKEIGELKGKLAAGGSSGGEDEITEVEGVKLLAKRVATAEPKVLREAADTLRTRLGSGVVVLAGEDEGKARLIVAVTKDLTKRVHAGKLVGSLASHVDGKGGGRPDLAQAGGPKVAGLDAVVSGAAEGLKAQLTS